MPLCSQEFKTFQHHQEKVSCFSCGWNPMEGWGGKTSYDCNVRSYLYPLNPLHPDVYQHTETRYRYLTGSNCMWITGLDVEGRGGSVCQCHMSSIHHRCFADIAAPVRPIDLFLCFFTSIFLKQKFREKSFHPDCTLQIWRSAWKGKDTWLYTHLLKFEVTLKSIKWNSGGFSSM